MKKPNAHDWNKLWHVIGCLWFTRSLPLIIAIDDDGNSYAHVDRSYAVYADSRRNSSLSVAMRTGAMINDSKKVGLTTNRSTETEIASNEEPFFKEGERGVLLMQDNKSCMLFHKNYPLSI